MFIPDPTFFHPGYRIRIKEFKNFNPKNGFRGQKGSGSRIRLRIRNTVNYDSHAIVLKHAEINSYSTYLVAGDFVPLFRSIFAPVLWIRTGFNVDPDPCFYLNADLDADPYSGSQINADSNPSHKNFHAPGSGSAFLISIRIQNRQINADPDPQHGFAWTHY
jgi:hypothetical protein